MATSKIVLSNVPVQITDGTKTAFIQNRSGENIYVFSSDTPPTQAPDVQACYLLLPAHVLTLSPTDKYYGFCQKGEASLFADIT